MRRTIHEIVNEGWVYHMSDGKVRLVMDEDELTKLKNYVATTEDILKRIRLVIYAEQNALIPFNHDEQNNPTLTEFGVLLRKMNVSEADWYKIKDFINEVKYANLK